MREEAMIRTATAVAVLAALVAGCGDDFTPFNELDRLRVLAVRAEPPELAPGATTTLDALVFAPDGDAVTSAWSWCPITLGAAKGYECALSEQQLADAIDAVAPGAGALVPSYDLGQGAEATFANAVPPAALAALCDAIATGSAPAFVDLPTCTDRFVVTIRLEVAAAGETVTAIKQLPLLFDASAEENLNPALGGVFAAPAADGVDPLVDGTALSFGREPTMLRAGAKYDLGLEIADAAAQSFTPAATVDSPSPDPRRETLFLTWFVTGGKTDSQRTGFIDGDADMSDLAHNGWRTPSLAASGGAAELYLVLQDERGGVAWTARQIALAGGE
jgi:hypothetical protein